MRTVAFAAVLALAEAFTGSAFAFKLPQSKITMHGGKGFGGGEATRDPAPTYVDPSDPKGKQQAIHKAESFADYLAKRGGGGGSPAKAPSAPPPAKAPAAATATHTATWLAFGAPILTLEAADRMANVALQEAASRRFNPVSVCVLDAAGRMIVHKTMIGCGNLSPEFAKAKATVCVGLLCSSRELRDKYQNSDGIGPKMPQLLGMGTAAAAVHMPIAAFPGGVLCRDANRNVVGAIGVSGAASDEDEHCAITAATSVGLVTEPAASRLV